MSNQPLSAPARSAAQLLVDCLQQLGVEIVFGIPGAKIDAVFDALADSPIRLIVCRHEQNAAFMAGCMGRLTGKPGVVLVTSGPGVSNLATGLVTATTEGDPMVALGGAVPRAMKLKQTHQNMDNVSFARPLTKHSVEAEVPESIPEILQNAFRVASAPRSGAVFVSLPQDVLAATVQCQTPKPLPPAQLGPAPQSLIQQAAERIRGARLPVLLLGLDASRPRNAEAVRRLLRKSPIATIQTFEAAGVLARDLVHCFVGRVGLFRNQPGDRLLQAADLLVTIGFSPVEYDPEVWNADNRLPLIHIDAAAMDAGHNYHPALELRGDIEATLDRLTEAMGGWEAIADPGLVDQLRRELDSGRDRSSQFSATPIHPLRFIHDLQTQLDENTTVISDVGSHYMWLARHLLCYSPRHLLFSNGQQTLGVALPWAIACTLVRPAGKVISISGDGGFLFSAMELETAVREKCHFVHFVWRDGAYDMVAAQQRMKYGRTYGVQFGSVDLVSFAQSFGAHGIALQSADQIIPALHEAESKEGPVLIDVRIDYRDNDRLFEMVDSCAGH